MRELFTIVSSLKLSKASGDDDIPAEFWKALVDDGENETSSYFLCIGMSQKTVPNQWHVTRIAAIFQNVIWMIGQITI